MTEFRRVPLEVRCSFCGSGSVSMRPDFSGEFCRWCGEEFDRVEARRKAFEAAGLKPLTTEQVIAKVEEILNREDGS